MNIRYLRIFQTVCQEETITKAAKKLYMTQPAVSHVIHDLETDLQLPLFDRIGKRLYLNETGKLFLIKARKILELYEELEQGFSDISQQAVLRIGSSITIAKFWLSDFMEQFQTVCPRTPTRVVIDRANEITDRLLKNEIDLAFIEGVIPQNSFIKIPFSSYHLIVVASPCHPLTSCPQISPNQLANECFLMREKGSAIRDSWDSFLLLHNLSISPCWISVNSQTLIQAAKKNLGITVLPDILVKEELEHGELAMLNIDGMNCINENHIVYHKDKILSESMRKLIVIAQKLSK